MDGVVEAAAAPRDLHACVSRALSYLIPSRINFRRRPTAPRISPVVEGRAESVVLFAVRRRNCCFPLKPGRIYQAVFSSKNSTALLLQGGISVFGMLRPTALPVGVLIPQPHVRCLQDLRFHPKPYRPYYRVQRRGWLLCHVLRCCCCTATDALRAATTAWRWANTVPVAA